MAEDDLGVILAVNNTSEVQVFQVPLLTIKVESVCQMEQTFSEVKVADSLDSDVDVEITEFSEAAFVVERTINFNSVNGFIGAR